MAVDAEGDQVASAKGRVARERPGLRQVADAPVARAVDALSVDLDRSLAEVLESEDRAEKGRLAGAAGPEDRDQLARFNGEIEAAPEFAPAATECGTPDLERGCCGPGHRVSVPASSSMFCCIHST